MTDIILLLVFWVKHIYIDDIENNKITIKKRTKQEDNFIAKFAKKWNDEIDILAIDFIKSYIMEYLRFIK